MIAGGITVRELVTKLGFDVDTSKLKAFERRLGGVSKKMMKVGKTMTIGVTLPIVALGAAFIKAASDAEETASKFGTVFQDVEDSANSTAKALASDFGLSTKAAKKLLGDTGDLLTGFGFTGKAALDLSKKTNELAVDLASFTNFAGGAAGASAALTKGLLGETESLKTLGVAILQKDVKTEVATMKARGMRFETERQAKAYATLAIAQRQSKNAIGDFARTSKSFANQLRTFKAKLDNVSVAFGNILLPAMTKVLAKLVELAEKFDGMSEETKEYILIFAGIAAVIGPAIFLFGAFIKSMLLMKVAFLAAGKAAVFLKTGIAGVLAKAAIVTLMIGAWTEIYRVINGEQDTFIHKFGDFLMQFEIWRDLMDGIADTVRTIFGTPLPKQVGARSREELDKEFEEQDAANAMAKSQPVVMQNPAANSLSNTKNFKADITVNVPPGANQSEIGGLVEEAVQRVFDADQRQTMMAVEDGGF